MDLRDEARIGSALLMLGAALTTLSSLTGLGMTGQAGIGSTLVLGALVIAMVICAGGVLVKASAPYALAGIATGLAAVVAGGLLIDHLFLYVFPGFHALASLAALVLIRHHPRPGHLRRTFDPPLPQDPI